MKVSFIIIIVCITVTTINALNLPSARNDLFYKFVKDMTFLYFYKRLNKLENTRRCHKNVLKNQSNVYQ